MGYGCARQTAAESIRRRTRTNGARGPCVRRRAESALRSASSGCSTRSRLRRQRALTPRAARAMHAQSTRHARESGTGWAAHPRGHAHGSPAGPATRHADRILTKVRAARWRAVPDPRGAAADERQMLRTRTARRHREKTKTWPEERKNNKQTHTGLGAVRMQSCCTLHYVCCVLHEVTRSADTRYASEGARASCRMRASAAGCVASAHAAHRCTSQEVARPTFGGFPAPPTAAAGRSRGYS